jgi:hypothetical protein
VLLGQVFWYRRRRRLHPELYVASDAAPRASSAWDDESAPLLANGKAASRTALWKRIARHAAPYLAGCAFIVSFGFLAWFATTRRQDRLHRHPQIPQEEWDTSAQVVGWISAALYRASGPSSTLSSTYSARTVGSRIPQILKNRETHCAGLSLVMFFFSVIGNITYAASIFIPSLSVEHLYINSSFLAGSLGTMCVPMTVSRLGLIAGSFLDVVILYQASPVSPKPGCRTDPASAVLVVPDCEEEHARGREQRVWRLAVNLMHSFCGLCPSSSPSSCTINPRQVAVEASESR